MTLTNDNKGGKNPMLVKRQIGKIGNVPVIVEESDFSGKWHGDQLKVKEFNEAERLDCNPEARLLTEDEVLVELLQ